MNADDHFQIGERLAGIEGEIKNLAQGFNEFKQNYSQGFSEFKLGIGKRMEEGEKHMNKHCGEIKVLQERIDTVRLVVYGFVGLILTSFVIGLIWFKR